MSRRLLIGGLLAVTAVAFYAPPAVAAFHLWTISEVYSNSDGSVQFIELFTSSVGQTFTNGTQIKSNGNTFTFPANLSQDTTNKHMLLATAGFGSLTGGVTPDFTIPSHFFNPAGDTINYVFTLAGTVTFASAPTNGISSLNFPGPTTAANSPTNLAGMSGSVNLAPPPRFPATTTATASSTQPTTRSGEISWAARRRCRTTPRPEASRRPTTMFGSRTSAAIPDRAQVRVLVQTLSRSLRPGSC